jgi:hypothetical protein
LGVVIANAVNGVCEEMDGVRGDVGDLSESAVLRRVKARSSSFSDIDWRRGERRREGDEDILEASLISVGARVDTSVSASESVPDDEASLADDDGRRGISSDVNAFDVDGIAEDICLFRSSNRFSELYTLANGKRSTHMRDVTMSLTYIAPLIMAVVGRWRLVACSYFSLYPTLSSWPFSTCRRLRTASPGRENSLLSFSSE